MNQAHLDILSSEEWAETLRTEIFPWVLEAGDVTDAGFNLGRGTVRLCVSPILVPPTEQSICFRGVEETLLFAQRMAPRHGRVMPL